MSQSCPALTRGTPTACRSCIFQEGGPGKQCVEQVEKWQQAQNKASKGKKSYTKDKSSDDN